MKPKFKLRDKVKIKYPKNKKEYNELVKKVRLKYPPLDAVGYNTYLENINPTINKIGIIIAVEHVEKTFLYNISFVEASLIFTTYEDQLIHIYNLPKKIKILKKLLD
jgi:hypothetical protein